MCRCFKLYEKVFWLSHKTSYVCKRNVFKKNDLELLTISLAKGNNNWNSFLQNNEGKLIKNG